MPANIINNDTTFRGAADFSNADSFVPKDASISNSHLSSTANIERSKLEQNALVLYRIPLTAMRVWDAFTSLLPSTAADDDMALIMGTPGTNAPTLQGVDFGGTTSDEKCGFEFVLPAEYDDAESVQVRVRAAMNTTVADTSCTIGTQCWSNDDDGTVSANLCTTSAQSMNSLTVANYDFAITSTSLSTGDSLQIVLAFAGTDSGNAGVMIPEIYAVYVMLDIRG